MDYKIFLLFAFLPFMACSPNSKNNDKGEEITENYQAEERESYIEHYDNGVKKIEGLKVGGKRHGKWNYYYEDGILWSEGVYRYGVREGRSIVYYENGKKKIQGQYKNDLRVGEWKVWDDDGSLVKVMDLDSLLTASDSVHLGLK